MGILNTLWFRISIMPFYIQRPSVIDRNKTVYFVEETHWSENIENKATFATRSEAEALTVNDDGTNGSFKFAEVVEA